MEWAMVVVAVAVLGIGAVAATGRFGAMKEEPVRDTYRQQLPDTPLGRVDVEGLRFGIALRGYSMGQVDEVLDRLAREIAQRDARLAELEERLVEDLWPSPTSGADPEPHHEVGPPPGAGPGDADRPSR